MRAVLIDLDGTLLDTAPDLAAAANSMLDELGLARLAPAVVREFVGKGIQHLVHRSLAASLGAAPEASLLERARESFAKHYERTNGRSAAMFPGVREGLEQMRAQQLRLACVTNKAERYTRPLLAATGLDQYFAVTVTADMVGRRKPDPDIFLHACAALEAEPDQACVIGDSDNDALGARAAGCGFLLVPYGYREGKDVRDIASDGIVGSLLDAAAVFAAKNGASRGQQS
jgi:phosphoglycolate phosphatase